MSVLRIKTNMLPIRNKNPALITLVLLTSISLTCAGDVLWMSDDLLEDPFVFTYQNRSTCGHHSSGIKMMAEKDGDADDDSEQDALAGEFPWQAAIFHQQVKVCSAVLIHEEWLLTAASCLPFLNEPYSVTAGSLSLLSEDLVSDDKRHGQRRRVSDVFVHPRFAARQRQFDIALVRVGRPFELNDKVNVICLPLPMMRSLFQPGTRTTVPAWGDLSSHTRADPKGSDSEARRGILKRFKISLLNHSVCNASFSENIPNTILCAGRKRGENSFPLHVSNDGGFLAILRKKLMMVKTLGKAGRVDKEENEGDDGVDATTFMPLLMNEIDRRAGGAGFDRRRLAGAWSVGTRALKMRVETMEEDDTMEVDGKMDGDDDMMERGEMEGRSTGGMLENIVRGCKGDKGGPLLGQFGDQWYVLGITSLPYGCPHQDSPGLFTNLFSLRDWIKPIFNGKDPKRKSTRCVQREFSCGDGWCIPQSFRCDGIVDCTLGTDEGRMCDGAIKGFNIYLNHRIDETTVARTFSVNSTGQCALECLRHPFLCSGFDVYFHPAQMDSPPRRSEHEDDSKTDDSDEEEDDYKMEESEMMMGRTPMTCALANGRSRVHRTVFSSVSLRRVLMGLHPTEPVSIHAKLPQVAPLTALLSPEVSLSLQRGLIVSPSYILGPRLSRHIGKRTFILSFMRNAIFQRIIKLALLECITSLESWTTILKMNVQMARWRKVAAKMEVMLTKRDRDDGEDSGPDLERLMMRVVRMKNIHREMKSNHTRIMIEMNQRCNISDIEHRFKQVVKDNSTCMKESTKKNEGGTKPTDRYPDFRMESEVADDTFESILPELMMQNMYIMENEARSDRGGMSEPDVEMKSGVEDIMMYMGSMMGDFWGMVGSDDPVSSFLLDTIKQILKKDKIMMMLNVKIANFTSMSIALFEELNAIDKLMSTDGCNKTNGESAMHRLGIEGDDGDSADDVTAKNSYSAVKRMEMVTMPSGHQRWVITQTPHQVNSIHFRVLDARGPKHCNNLLGDFGMLIARGVRYPCKMVTKSENIRERVMLGKKMEFEKDFMSEDDGVEDLREVLSRLVSAIAEDDIGEKLLDGPIREAYYFLNSTVSARIDLRALQTELGDRLLKMRLSNARGVACCLNDINWKKSIDLTGSVALVEQYSTNQSQHGIIMEYESDWSCDQHLTQAPGVATSPRFPERYPRNAACETLISAPRGSVIALYILRFCLQWSPACQRDSLTVLDKTTHGWRMVGGKPFCGTTVPHVFRSSGPQLLIRFKSDQEKEALGYEAAYAFAPAQIPSQMFSFQMEKTTPPSEINEEIDGQMEVGDLPGKIMSLKIALMAVGGVLIVVIVVGMVFTYKRYVNRKKILREIYDTKM